MSPRHNPVIEVVLVEEAEAADSSRTLAEHDYDLT